jgi:Ca2+-binding RTX toxin-like protein
LAILIQNLFTNSSDLVASTNGWEVLTGTTIDALNGNDTVTGSGGIDGIFNRGTFYTGDGNDTIKGSGSDLGIVNSGSIDTGKGNDILNGSGGNVGIGNFTNGTIYTGKGNDILNGSGGRGGIFNSGMINTDKGNDSINGNSDSVGIANFDNSTIYTSKGNDSITGRGNDFGIANYSYSIIDTGKGNDSITGSSNNVGIANNGTIVTGEDNDIVNALVGGFFGTGTTDLGTGTDILKGFGSGNFIGGDGVDKILFGQGSYTISGGLINGIMNVTSFENIGGANGGLFAFGNGTLTVNSLGVATSFVI